MTSGIIVIKYGGSLLEEPDHRSVFLKDVAKLSKKQKVILVHGGGKEITRELEKKGIKPRFIEGRRYTDNATMVVVDKVLERINKLLVEELQKQRVKAQGFSGKTEQFMGAQALPGLGRVGEPQILIPEVLERILKKTELPVFYSVAVGPDHDFEGGSYPIPYNVNADDFALEIARVCRAQKLVFLTDTGGVVDARGKLIPQITPESAQILIQKNVVTGGMLLKVKACIDALKMGIGSVDIVKGIRYLLEPDKNQPEGTIFRSS